MRKVEPPPFLSETWEFIELRHGLIPQVKLSEISEINDSTYPYWEKWKYLAKDWQCAAKTLWKIVKVKRSLTQKRIKFNSSGKFNLYINTPSVVQQKLHELDLSLGGNLSANDIIPTEEKHRYLISSLMEEAIASSQLEGAATTRKVAKEMLESNRKPRNVSEQMIVNNYAAMQWIVKNKDITVNAETILQIHRIITTNTLADKHEEGAFRRSNDVRIVDVQTGAILHTPPPQEDLESLMAELCKFINDTQKEDFFLHPISKAIIVHFLIGYIHPFADGNGRTARALFYWYLIKKGYWLIEYMSVSRIILGSKAQYARAYQYTEKDGNDLTYFILYNLKCIENSLNELKKYIERKNREKKNILALLRNTTYNDRQIVLIEEIINNKKAVFSVQEVQNKFGVSNQTARTDLNYLVSKGILETRKSGNRIQFLLTDGGEKKIIEKG
ncbi:Fic family protein [Puia dinghuensis]|uniref:Transposase n=1 Tax=Puia dinghuensis TaxID=1792502 RepID=A0A8J2XUW3_9BACT|nr:Fic family protein [Puia dinghuensis]GGB14714.1 transposase [Puia dinghuensis]